MKPNKTKARRNTVSPLPPEPSRLALARRLALLADCELQHGHHTIAERLAFRAEAMRAEGRQ